MTQNLLDPQETEIKDPLEHLIGPGGKFYDPDKEVALRKLAEGKIESDRFINHKNKEFDSLREDYLKISDDLKTRATAEEVLALMRQEQTSSSAITPKANEAGNQPSYNPDDFKKLARQEYSEMEKQRREDANFSTVREKLIERFGNNYQSQVAQQINELGLTPEEFNDRARRNPKDLFRTLGLDQQPARQGFQSPPRSDVRSDNFSPNTNKRTWSYYEKLRADNPREYLSPKIQTQMLQDMKQLGTAFQDGDW